MKKLERKTRDEKRRLQLNKANPQAAAAALEKVQGLNRRVLAVVLAIAMVASLLTVGAVFLKTKGASTKEMIPFDPNDNYTYTITDGTKYVEGGTYYYEYDNRVYTYVLTENLPAGTVMTFNENTKDISWATNNTYNRTNITSVTGVSVDPNNTDATHATLNIAKTASLTAGTEYYYDMGNGSYYVFQIDDTYTGRRTDTVRGANNTEVQYTEGTLVLDFENQTADIDGTQYDLHYLYVKADGLNANDVYLVAAKNSSGTENIVAINSNGTTSVPQTTYQYQYILWINAPSVTAYQYTTSAPFSDATALTGTEFTDNRPYYDGGAIVSSTANGKSQYMLGELKAISVNESSYPNHFYLKPINASNYSYYTNTALGHVYSSANNVSLYLHEYYDNTVRYNTSQGQNYRGNPKYGSYWSYQGSELVNARNSYTGTEYVYLKAATSANTTPFVLSNSAGGQVNLYKQQLTPVPTDYQNTGSGTVYTNAPGAVSPTNVSYTDNLTVDDNDLELDKTVTRIDDETYKVHLEAYTTAEKIKQPVTDVVMVMDTSRKMNSELYDREYKNLNTYTKFSPVSLVNVIHDDLFDGDLNTEDYGILRQLIEWVGGNIADALSNRVYGSNRYVEDPNYPGTYVYLYQKYTSSGGAIFGDNHFTYYFTSADGTEYSTVETTESRINTALYMLAGRNANNGGSIGSLTFYEDGNTANAPLSVSTIYKRDGTNMNNALNHSTSDLSNTGLYEISTSSGGLYVRDNDGAYKRVTITPVDKNLQPTTESAAVLYKYTVEDHPELVMYQGASQGGVQDSRHHPEYYGVYQGFRYYKPDPDNPNKLIIDEERSLISKSLYTKEDSTVTRLQALKEASEEFLLSVYKQSQKADINVGIVTYDTTSNVLYPLGQLKDGSPADLSNANHIDQMISDIYGLTANTNSPASSIDDGMAAGRNEFTQRSAPENRRFLLLFSGGVPADYNTIWFFGTRDISSGDYSTDVATNAIRTAYDLKNNMNTTIYSVGLFENADNAESATYGHRYYYGLHPSTINNNEIGNSWGRTGTANFIINNWTNLSIDPMDAAATNRLLGYISSDYATAQNIGLNRYDGGLFSRTNPGLDYFGRWYYLFSLGGPGYRVTNRYTKTDSGHYFGVSPVTVNEAGGSGEEGSDVTVIGKDPAEVIAQFKEAFDSVIAQTSVPSNILDENAKLLDGITEYFTLKPETVEGYTMSTTDNGATWTGKDTSLVRVYDYNDPNEPIYDGTKTLVATGHSYKDYYVNPDTGIGKKIVLEFEVERIPDLIGGNNIPTNLNNSGIYDGNPLENPLLGELGVLEEKFEVPKVDLSIIDIETIAADQSAYYGSEADLQEMLNPYWVNGKNNEFVNMEYTFYDPDGQKVNTYTVPAGNTEGTWETEIDSAEDTHARFIQMFETSDFEVHLKVIPSTSGTVRTRDDYDPANAKVYVFTPHYDVFNDRVEEANDPYVLSTIPRLGDWELDMTGIDTTGMDEDDLDAFTVAAFDLLAYKQMPEVDYGLKNITADTDVTNKDAQYPIPEKTVFEMQDIMVTPVPVPYLAKNVITGYILYNGTGDNAQMVGVQTLDADGNVAETVWYDTAGNVTDTPQQYTSQEEIRGDVTRYAQRADVDATNVTSVLNSLTNIPQNERPATAWQDGNTDKQFTISLMEHEVTITNTTYGKAGADYSDPNKAFHLAITMKNNGTIVPSGTTVNYTDPETGTTQTLTFNNVGQAFIDLKHNQSTTLLNVPDGYTIEITSNPSDLYQFSAEVDGTTLGVNAAEVTDPVTINGEKTIDLTHYIELIPVTGFSENSQKFLPFFIIAGILALAGGIAFGVYLKRKREGLTQ